MKQLLAAALIVLASNGFAAAEDAGASGKAALVIGNSAYQHAPEAATATRDARAVATALEEAGWQVTQGLDLDRAGMRRVIETFAAASAEADSAVIFYSGHAIRTGGVSFLAPVTTPGRTLTDVVFDGVPLDLLIAIAAEKPGRAVVFIDGAQLAGFTPTDRFEPGLADLEGPDGVLIVSAAEPGHAVRRLKDRDSRFARLIIDQFLSPGEAAVNVAAAAPAPTWIYGATDEDFVLSPLPEPAADGIEAEIELAYWRTAEQSGDPADYQAYLRRYPNGVFADFARRRLGIEASAEVPEEPEIDPRIQVERDLQLSRLAKRRIQEYLLALGFDPNGIDGLFGPGSRNAITSWQRANDMENEGWLTAEQVALLTEQGEAAIAEQRRIAEQARQIAEAEDNAYWAATGATGSADGFRSYLEAYPEGLHARTARAALARMAEAEADAEARDERRVFRRAKRQNTAIAYRDYLVQYPDGIYRDEALAALDEIENAEHAAAERKRLETIEANLGLSKNDRLSLEQRLRYLGFEIGVADGRFDARTRSGIRGYQASRALGETGYFDRQTVVTLVRETDRRRSGTAVDGAQVIQDLLEALQGN